MLGDGAPPDRSRPPTDSPPDTTDEPALHVQGLEKTFGDGEDAVTAVDGLSLSVDHGEVVGLLGPNGAGKTTAISSMLGLVLPDAGCVEVCGVDVHEDPARAYRHLDAMLEGARNVYWRLTVRENLRFFAGLGGTDPDALGERHERLLETLDLADVADTVVNELSRGMKQKVSLATTLARDVDVVFLDEPTLGLDIESSIELRSELRRLAEIEDVTIVLCSHDMAVIEAVSDRIVILQDGSVIADDSMDALVDVLTEKRYTVRAEGPIEGALREDLRQRFDATIEAVEGASDDGPLLDVHARGIRGEGAADLLALLREAGRPLVDVETAEPTLEEVFLRLTGEDASRVGSATAESVTAEEGRADPTAPGEGPAERGSRDHAAAGPEVTADGDR